jgi:hypothetical protein
MIRTLAIVIVVLAGTAHARPLLGVSSVTASSEVKDADYKTWGVIGTTMGQWCVNAPNGGVGESLTIAFDPPAALADVDISNSGGDTNQVSQVEAIADGRALRATAKKQGVGASTLVVKLDGKPVTKLVVKIAAIEKGNAPATCIRSVALNASSSPGIVYGAAAADVAALEGRVTAIRDALRTCKGLGDALAFPFAYHEMTMDQNGMKENVHAYKTAAAATAACKKKKLAQIVDDFDKSGGDIGPEAAGKVIVGGTWHVGLVDKTWRLVKVSM